MSFKVEDHYDLRKHLHVDHNMIFYEERKSSFVECHSELKKGLRKVEERFKKGLFIRSFLGTVKKRVLGMLDARGNAMLVFRHFHKSAWKSTRLLLAPTTFRHPSTPW